MEDKPQAAPETQAQAAPETAEQPANKKEEKKKTVGQEILSWILTFAVAIALALVIRTFIFEPVRVDGHSMDYTLADNEYMIVTKYDYLLGEPERFDVIICHYPERGRTNFVKRLVGLPGDTVAAQNGVIYLNGEPLEEDYVSPIHAAHYDYPEIVLAEGEYFLLGDNRAVSHDSHSADVGPVTDIVGKARAIIWPPAHISGL